MAGAHTGGYDASAERQQNIVGKRIQEARKARGWTLREMSQALAELGVSVKHYGISKWECGDAVPNAYQLLAVCRALAIEDLAYLSAEPPASVLNEAGLRRLQAYREDLIASGRYRVKPHRSRIVYGQWPVSDLAVSAGTGEFLEEGRFEMVSFPVSAVPDRAEFGVRVSGDSMEPVYHDGQIVWVQTCDRLEPGEVGVFMYDGAGYLKSYDEQLPEDREAFLDSAGVLHMQPVLVSYNEKYPPKVISPELPFTVVGRVLNGLEGNG